VVGVGFVWTVGLLVVYTRADACVSVFVVVVVVVVVDCGNCVRVTNFLVVVSGGVSLVVVS